ncbi:hypothetical protein C5167_004815 [Papaver somniferum]|uniref:Uncharacterized protein n=1 Tax=Papaver somniferum TaxID=3469 RepID=A0A4Y7JC82_PAPSO|nr:hypothetical protein C5167_004815 [Papaver somniferum]
MCCPIVCKKQLPPPPPRTHTLAISYSLLLYHLRWSTVRLKTLLYIFLNLPTESNGKSGKGVVEMGLMGWRSAAMELRQCGG